MVEGEGVQGVERERQRERGREGGWKRERDRERGRKGRGGGVEEEGVDIS